MIIGIDFDNTIVSYDKIFFEVAKELNLISKDTFRNKTEVRDEIRKIKGDIEWQKIQSIVYAYRMDSAEIMDGLGKFLEFCKENRAKVYIVSHKTMHAHFDEEKRNLRQIALDWLKKNEFFSNNVFNLEQKDVFFESTREEKVQRIADLNCDIFIDDLEEVFLEKSFPKETKKILFLPEGEKSPHLVNCTVCRSWVEVYKIVSEFPK